MTKQAILTRNRANARHSTGPITANGKAMSRRNALRHGLTASPAAGVAESPARFEKLLRRLHAEIQPRGTIESALVHRIATAIWRLQRAARIDAAVTAEAVGGVRTASEDVEYWMSNFMNRWRSEAREMREPDEELRRLGKKTKIYCIRPGVDDLDQFRDKIMWNGAAITAMMQLIESLGDLLNRCPSGFNSERCEQLSWALGDRCGLSVSETAGYPDMYPNCTANQKLIGVARKRIKGEPMSVELAQVIRARLQALDHLRRTCDEPYFYETWERHKTAAMLPEEKLLERLVRYEVHNDRALSRALETLAKLRGASVERLAASLTTTTPEGTQVQVSGERTQWQPLRE